MSENNENLEQKNGFTKRIRDALNEVVWNPSSFNSFSFMGLDPGF